MAEPVYKFRLYCTACNSPDHTKLVRGDDPDPKLCRLYWTSRTFAVFWCERCKIYATRLDEERD